MASLKQRILCRLIGGHFWTKGQRVKDARIYRCTNCGAMRIEYEPER